jgi:hypothetical protein
MTDILDKYRDVVVVNANHIGLEISLALKNEPTEKQREAFFGTMDTGFWYVHRLDKHPDTVYECIVSTNTGDAITSLYKNHRIFNTHGDLARAREELIKAIAHKVGLSHQGVGIDDPVRGRVMELRELSTGQLIDLLAERSGKTVLVTNSHSAGGIADSF